MTKNVDNIKDWQRWTKESNVRTTTVHDQQTCTSVWHLMHDDYERSNIHSFINNL